MMTTTTMVADYKTLVRSYSSSSSSSIIRGETRRKSDTIFIDHEERGVQNKKMKTLEILDLVLDLLDDEDDEDISTNTTRPSQQ